MMYSVVTGTLGFKYHDPIKELEFLGETFVQDKPGMIYGEVLHSKEVIKNYWGCEKHIAMEVLLS